ncbi:hypothetical protein A2810_00615 [candidate division Kazan bacterium RIFCSPHIGHO2_01_FULL_49_10]|uniref:Uncharacterized protein n=1 Tax=candidate division Kazan bacterium RIFCSPLOWO2_01_FULL_48_13 TaxID=1798539 RepID=A0A1F4PNC1_UNCK3|nr:MAG: hypothetical protein A2810_00615 [candidate division Kazan bacterium RIFCSPHIGHO2_01_FULL_49_10]OGB85135.1 MAG: hypothetical protein A2994_03850 [candidate division Kazan bacterium RIFCSPLOWO2_01_FULL_48_13]
MGWLIDNKEFVGIVIAFLSVIIPLMTFLIGKNREQRQVRFEKFHKDLMRNLSNLAHEAGADQQIAIIFELRNFPEYYPVVRRILTDLRDEWAAEGAVGRLNVNSVALNRMVTECDATIEFMAKNFLDRFWIRAKDYWGFGEIG